MGIKVIATRMGQYGDHASEARLYAEGEVFEVKTEAQLGSWMERLDGKPNPAHDKTERAAEYLAKNNGNYAPIDTSKVRAVPAASKGDKLAAARKANELKRAAAKKLKEDEEDKDLAKGLI